MRNNKKLCLLPLAILFCVLTVNAAQASTNDEEVAKENVVLGTEAEVGPADNPEKNAEQLAAVLQIEADKDYGEYLAGECAACHAPSGGDGSIPRIHAKAKDYLASALLEYKNLQRPNEVMRGVTAALTNDEIAALATYFSEQ